MTTTACDQRESTEANRHIFDHMHAMPSTELRKMLRQWRFGIGPTFKLIRQRAYGVLVNRRTTRRSDKD